MSVKFSLDEEKNALNIWKVENSKDNFLINKNSKFSFCRGKSFEECKEILIKENKKFFSSTQMKIFLEAIEKSWNDIEKEFFLRADKIFNKKLEGNFRCYLTTIERCSYDIEQNYFFVSFFYSLPKALLSIGHELFHFYFHRFYFRELEKKIGREKTNDFKEALTILLNLEFNDLFLIEDKGYEKHKDLREFIKEKWLLKKDFEYVLCKFLEISS